MQEGHAQWAREQKEKSLVSQVEKKSVVAFSGQIGMYHTPWGVTEICQLTGESRQITHPVAELPPKKQVISPSPKIMAVEVSPQQTFEKETKNVVTKYSAALSVEEEIEDNVVMLIDEFANDAPIMGRTVLCQMAKPRNRPGKPGRPARPKKRGRGRRNAGNLTSGGGGGANTMMYEPWMPIFPASVTKRLRYSTSISLSSTSGVITSTYVFRANDLFDPDFTSTGHQPMGFDQLMSFYNHFVVRRARITLLIRNTTDSQPTVCVRVDADSTALTTIDRIVEFGGCETIDLDTKLASGATKKLVLSVDIAKMQGIKPSALTADVNLRGTAATSPTEVTYFHVTMWNTSGITGAATADVILEQVATFTEPRDLTASLKDKPLLIRPSIPLEDDAKHDHTPSIQESDWAEEDEFCSGIALDRLRMHEALMRGAGHGVSHQTGKGQVTIPVVKKKN